MVQIAIRPTAHPKTIQKPHVFDRTLLEKYRIEIAEADDSE
jgi:hypothetical protein